MWGTDWNITFSIRENIFHKVTMLDPKIIDASETVSIEFKVMKLRRGLVMLINLRVAGEGTGNRDRARHMYIFPTNKLLSEKEAVDDQKLQGAFAVNLWNTFSCKKYRG